MGKRNDQLNPFRLLIAPDFYPIPGFSNYGIYEDGRVINIATLKELKQNESHTGYLRVSVVKDGSNYFNNIGVHRLMARTFLDPGNDYSIDELQVNHKDCNKKNNHIDNLEWVTPSENVQHGVEKGRYTDNARPVTMRNVFTGQIHKFQFASEAARFVGLNKDDIKFRLNCSEKDRVFPEGYQYRNGFEDDTPWRIPEDIHKEMLRYGNTRKVLVKYLLTNEVKEFNSLGDAAKALGIKLSTVSEWVHGRGNTNQPVWPGCVQLKFAYDPTPWREVKDPYLELQENTGRAVIQVVNDATGEKIIYESAAKCARAHGIGVTTLDWRLKTQGKKVYPDGFRYGYYPY